MTPPILTLSADAWTAFLSSLYERDDRLDLRRPGEQYRADETVDAYVFSGHAEAMQSAEVDGDLWGTLADIEEEASTEEDAWNKIVTFYQERGCLLLRIEGTGEREEWILTEGLARRLGLISSGA